MDDDVVLNIDTIWNMGARTYPFANGMKRNG